MSERVPIVGGNWKLNTDRAEAAALARDVAAGMAAGAHDGVDVVIFPPFPWLVDAVAAAAGTPVQIGSQNCSAHLSGAFTGAVSAAMVASAGATWCLAGHSERRHVFGETDAGIAARLTNALAAGLCPILCVGETEDDRAADRTESVIAEQLDGALGGIPAGDRSRITIAYEPVWAIGTGRTATPEDAQAVHAFIRTRLADRYDPGFAQSVRIQYGGSVKPANAADLIAQPDIDGFLVGGASLDPASFLAIIAAAG
ncbi:MAG: triose-phosphate isomerase [Phycisphaerales bacterium]